MRITTSFGPQTTQLSRKRLGAVAAVIALTATGVAATVGGPTFAGDDDNTVEPADAPAGELVVAEPLIQTGGSTFDETVLSKFIPATGFDPFNDGNFEQDLIDFDGQGCLHVDDLAAGTNTRMRAPVELPDGSRIKRLTFFGEDDSGFDITIRLRREEFTSTPQLSPTPPLIARSSATVNSFSTSGSSGEVQVAGTDDLGELVGTPRVGAPTTTTTRFHTVDVDLRNSAGEDHVLCGVKVDYQVPVSTIEAGDQYHAIDSIRAYDSRLGSFSPSGIVTPNSNRTIDITDGYDLDGIAVPAQADAIPAEATAITYNITVTGTTGPNFTSVTAGDAAGFTTSAINFGAGDEIANAGTVTISNGEIKLWGGSNTGSTHVVIDVTGFYAPGPPPSNMGN